MIEDIYDPLNEYISTFKDKFKKVADETFNALADEAQVDVEANRETCRQIYAGEKQLTDVSVMLRLIVRRVDKSMQVRSNSRMCLVVSRCGLSYASFCG